MRGRVAINRSLLSILQYTIMSCHVMSCHVMSCHAYDTAAVYIICAGARARRRGARGASAGWPKGVRHAESSRGLLAAALTVCQHRVATVIIIV